MVDRTHTMRKTASVVKAFTHRYCAKTRVQLMRCDTLHERVCVCMWPSGHRTTHIARGSSLFRHLVEAPRHQKATKKKTQNTKHKNAFSSLDWLLNKYLQIDRNSSRLAHLGLDARAFNICGWLRYVDIFAYVCVMSKQGVLLFRHIFNS